MILFMLFLGLFVITAIAMDLMTSRQSGPGDYIGVFSEKAEKRIRDFRETYRKGGVAKPLRSMSEAELDTYIRGKMVEHDNKSAFPLFCIVTGIAICIPAG